MSMDVDNAGGLMVAGLVAGEIEGATARKDEHAAHGAHCANCQAVLAGPFCGSCGQRAHLHRSLLHFGEELLHGILHFDAKAWRTLPMLIGKPGVLTRRYIDGQRARFVSPLALFLFMIFFMFFVVSHVGADKTAGEAPITMSPADKLQKIQTKLATKLQQKRERAEEKLAAERAAGKDTADTEASLSEVRQAQADAQLAAKAGAAASSNSLVNINVGNVGINTGMPSLDRAIEHARENPELTLYKLKNAASKYSFLLVPISLPFMWLMFFWRRDITLYDHAVFALYSLSFMAVLVSVVAVAGSLGFSAVAGLLICFAPPIHMYFQLRDTYGLSRMSTLWRTVSLLFVALTVFVIYLLIILTLSTQ